MNSKNLYRFWSILKIIKKRVSGDFLRNRLIRKSSLLFGAALLTSSIKDIQKFSLCETESPNSNDLTEGFSLDTYVDYLGKFVPKFIDKHAQSVLNVFHLANLSGILSIPLLIVSSSVVDLCSWYVYCHLKTAQHMVLIRNKFVKDYYKGNVPKGSPFDPKNFWMRFNKDVISYRVILIMMLLCQAYLMSMALTIFSKGKDQVIKNPYDEEDFETDNTKGLGDLKEKKLSHMLWGISDSNDYTCLTIAVLICLPALSKREPRGFFIFPIAYLLASIGNQIPIGYSLIGLSWLSSVFLNMKLANLFWLSRVLSKEQLSNLERLYRGDSFYNHNVYEV